MTTVSGKLNWLIVSATLAALFAAAAPSARASVFTIREVHAATDPIDSLSKATQLLNGSIAASAVLDSSALVLNFIDPDAPAAGLFGAAVALPADAPFPGNAAAVDDNEFALSATADVVIPSAGAWTFGVNADNGVRVRVGSFVMSRSGFDASTLLQTFTFTEAGTYPLALTYYEHAGQSGVELFAAPGAITSGTDPAFRLVGDSLNGGLAVAPEPTGLMSMTFLAALLVARRNRLA